MSSNQKKDVLKQYDSKEMTKRAFKYLLQGIIVAMSSYYLPKQKLQIQDILLIAMTASISFSILDMYAPSIEYCNLN